jgi:hypothetical protein
MMHAAFSRVGPFLGAGFTIAAGEHGGECCALLLPLDPGSCHIDTREPDAGRFTASDAMGRRRRTTPGRNYEANRLPRQVLRA